MFFSFFSLCEEQQVYQVSNATKTVLISNYSSIHLFPFSHSLFLFFGLFSLHFPLSSLCVLVTIIYKPLVLFKRKNVLKYWFLCRFQVCTITTRRDGGVTVSFQPATQLNITQLGLSRQAMLTFDARPSTIDVS